MATDNRGPSSGCTGPVAEVNNHDARTADRPWGSGAAYAEGRLGGRVPCLMAPTVPRWGPTATHTHDEHCLGPTGPSCAVDSLRRLMRHVLSNLSKRRNEQQNRAPLNGQTLSVADGRITQSAACAKCNSTPWRALLCIPACNRPGANQPATRKR